MNAITEQAVRETAERNKALSKSAAEGVFQSQYTFHARVREEWWGLYFQEAGHQLRLRAEHLLRLFQPNAFYFDGDAYWLKSDEFDHLYFTPMVTRIINRHIANHPEIQLVDYKDLLSKLHPKQLKLF